MLARTWYIFTNCIAYYATCFGTFSAYKLLLYLLLLLVDKKKVLPNKLYVFIVYFFSITYNATFFMTVNLPALLLYQDLSTVLKLILIMYSMNGIISSYFDFWVSCHASNSTQTHWDIIKTNYLIWKRIRKPANPFVTKLKLSTASEKLKTPGDNVKTYESIK